MGELRVQPAHRMQIYLTLPGGQREGPYTLEEINRDLAAKKYSDTDYWAWYSGQNEWVPLHKVPGVVGSDDTTAWVLDPAAQASSAAPAEPPASAPATTSTDNSTASAIAKGAQQPSAAASAEPTASTPPPAPTPAPAADLPPAPDATPTPLDRKLFSGLPFAALEQVFILTTGDGPPASRSAVTARMLEETVGESLQRIRGSVSRDVLSRCAFMEQLRTQATLPTAAWSAMANFKLELVQAARAGLYKVCVRTFPIETGDLVCVFLFYNKQKL